MKASFIKAILISLVFFSSCKDYLNKVPTDFLAPANYYETEQHLTAARASIYDALAAGGLYGSLTHYTLGWTADEAYMNRSTLTAGPWNYFYNTADIYNNLFWVDLFSGINRTNVVLANVDKNPALSASIRDRLRGEALFLRGYFYSILVQYHGGVPIKTAPTGSVLDMNVPRNSVREVYDQILSDMEAAEQLVPDIRTVGFGGAISKSAVRGILARVNLTMAGHPLRDESRYAEARRWAKMVMDDTEANHSLNPSYQDIFKRLAADEYDIRESIWEVEFWGNLSEGYNEVGAQGWVNGPVSSDGSATGRGDSYMSITAKFYNVFSPGDLRKWYCIAHWTYNNNQTSGSKTMTAALPATEAAKYLLRPAKWRREYETKIPKAPTRTPQNVPLLRYADILMMYAEAENAINGPTPEAVNAVNQVRRRSWSSGVKEITVTNGGAGYTTAPTVVFSTENGSGAVATATVSGGRITRVTLARDTEGITYYREGKYDAPPAITFQSATGSGATAVATVYSLSEADLKPEHTASKESFLALIQDERMREFNFELSRKADLLRWGNFLQVNQDMGNTVQQDAPGAFYVKYYSNVSQRDLLMPIPNSEMTVNRSMVQNPGW